MRTATVVLEALGFDPKVKYYECVAKDVIQKLVQAKRTEGHPDKQIEAKETTDQLTQQPKKGLGRSKKGSAIPKADEARRATESQKPTRSFEQCVSETLKTKYSEGYALFISLKTPKEKAKNPSLGDEEIASNVRKHWEQLDESLQERFQKKAKKA